jgi:TP901 family phage tail tape measure protein
MAEDMNLQINITGNNETGPSMDSMNSSLERVQQMASEVTRTFQSFMESVVSAFTDAGRSAAELTRPLSELGADATRASEVARAVGEIATSAENATRQVDNMNRAMNHTSNSSSGGHSGHGEGGLFSMQGQMDTMYAGMAMGAAALPLVGIIKSSTDAYGQLSQSMANVNSMMGLSQSQLNGLTNQVIELSKTVPDGPVALAQALYGIVGAGVPAASQMDVLATASKAATAGQTDVATSTQALISVMNAYGLTGKDVGKISDEMFAANAAGALTFGQLANSIGTVAGPAAQAGVSFDQVAAATAALTNQGIDAQRATEGLRALIVGIMAPTHGATKEAKALGIEWDANALKSKGLAGMINEAMKATHGNSEELKHLIPNIAAWTAAVDLGGKGADSFKQAQDTMAKAAGATDKALEAQKKGFQEQTKEMQNSIQRAQIAFAGGFIPVITNVIDKIADLADKFSKLSPNTQKMIGDITLGTAAFLTLGSGLFMTLSGIGGLIGGLGALMSPVGLIIVSIGLLAAGFVYAYTQNKSFHDMVESLGGTMKWILPILGGVTAAITAFKVISSINSLITTWREVTAGMTAAQWLLNVALDANPIGLVALAIGGLVAAGIALYENWDTVKSTMTTIFYEIERGAASMVNGIIGGINDMIGAINSVTSLVGVTIPKLNQVHWGSDGAGNTQYAVSAIQNGGYDAMGTVNGAYLAAHKHATGGIFSTPHFGLVAEAGPEAIIPLSNPSRGLALWQQAGAALGVGGMALPGRTGGDVHYHITVNASGNITRNEEALGDIVSRAILNKTKMQGRI